MNTLHFLGTAGARYVTIRQLRKSAGIHLNYNDTQLLIDPGPGTLSQLYCSQHPHQPTQLEALLLTHRHIDHSNDINILMEAMSNGGKDPKGVVYAPTDALDDDPVILHHFRNKVNHIQTLQEQHIYQLNTISIQTPIKHHHGVETYGFKISAANQPTISLISDTEYFPELDFAYQNSDILILNVVLTKRPYKSIQHLDLTDAEHLIQTIQPKLAIITHFGMNMLKANPNASAQMLQNNTGVPTLAAYDDLYLEFDSKTLQQPL